MRRLLLASDPFEVALSHLPGRQLLTPNERAVEALRGAPATNRSLASSAAALLEDAGLREASEVEQLAATRAALRESEELAEGAASVTTLVGAISELLRAGLGRDSGVVERLLAAPELAQRTKALVRLTLRYRELLAGSQVVDPAEAVWAASRLEPRRASLLVAGYPRVGLAELAFLDAIADDGSVFVLPAGSAASAEAAGVLAARGWLVEDDQEALGDHPPAMAEAFRGVALRSLRLPDQEHEVRWALAEVKRLLRDGADQRDVTIVARDERLYGPLVDAVAHEFGVPLKLMYSVPLRSTRFGELLAGLGTALAAGLPFEATARLLSHPLLRALDSEAWTSARETHPSGLSAWQEIAPQTALLAWPAGGSLRQFRDLLQRLLDESGASGRLSERESRARERLESALEEYDQDAQMPLTAFLGLLEELLSVLSIPVDPPAKRGVEFHTPLAVFGARYEHVIVLGAAEGM